MRDKQFELLDHKLAEIDKDPPEDERQIITEGDNEYFRSESNLDVRTELSELVVGYGSTIELVDRVAVAYIGKDSTVRVYEGANKIVVGDDSGLVIRGDVDELYLGSNCELVLGTNGWIETLNVGENCSLLLPEDSTYIGNLIFSGEIEVDNENSIEEINRS